LEPDTVAELDAVLKSRDVAPTHPFVSNENAGDTPGTKPTGNGSARLDKRQIEQRIEEDRERHKRARESIWAVPGEDIEEMDKLWDASEVGEDEYVAADEDAEERGQAIVYG
jgi:CTD kinase subunit gamma